MSRKQDHAPRGQPPRPKEPLSLEPAQILLEDFPTINQAINKQPTTIHQQQQQQQQQQEGVTAVTPYPQEAVDNLVDNLRQMGFVGARRWLAKGWPLEIVAEVVGEVQAAMETGTVSNPAGLVRSQVRAACPSIENGGKR